MIKNKNVEALLASKESIQQYHVWTTVKNKIKKRNWKHASIFSADIATDTKSDRQVNLNPLSTRPLPGNPHHSLQIRLSDSYNKSNTHKNTNTDSHIQLIIQRQWACPSAHCSHKRKDKQTHERQRATSISCPDCHDQSTQQSCLISH